jgi:hypothetical protein
LIGAGAGYLAARQRQASNRAELLKLIDGDAASDRRLVDKLTVLVEDLGNCRIGQMQGIQRRARQGEIDRDEADAQIADVEERILEDDEVISSVLGKAGHRLLTYIHAKTLVTAPSSQSSRPRPTVDVQIEIKPGNYVVTRRAHLRSEPSSSSDPPLEVYEPNREIYVTGRTTNNLWYAVSYESGPAFILASTVRGPLGREPVGELAESDRRLVERKEDSKIRIERHMKMLKRTVGAAGRGVTLPVFGA